MTKAKLIIHCAPSGVGTGSNLGMLTVDYAIQNIIKEIKAEDKIDIWSPWSPYNQTIEAIKNKERDNFNLNHKYNFSDYEKIRSDHTIFFWGDFQWGRDYQIQSSRRILDQKISGNSTELEQLSYNRFMLSKLYQENSNVNIMSYGTTLFQNRILDYQDEKYISNLEWLVKSAQFVKFRDPYSAFICEHLRQDYDTNYWGLDAAMLNTKNELLSLSKDEFTNQYQGQIGYFFGRSTGGYPLFHTAVFLNKLKKKLNKNIIRLPWANFSGSKLFVSRFDNLLKMAGLVKSPFENDTYMTGDILGAISKCSVIITDTYHVAINAITLNVPVIMLPEFSPKSQRNANMGYLESWRDKRVLLYQSLSLNDLMVLPDKLNDKNYVSKKIDLIKSIVDNNEILACLYSPIHKKAESERDLIKSILKKHLSYS